MAVLCRLYNLPPHYFTTRNKMKELGLCNSTALKTCSTLKSPMTTVGLMLKKMSLFCSYLTDISSFCRFVRFNRSDVSNRLSRFTGVERAFDSFSIHALLLCFILLEICNAWEFRFVTVQEML